MKLTTLRWIAIAPAILLAWLAAFLGGLLLLDIAHRFCPPDALISGACTADWYAPTELAIMAFSTALAGFLIVCVSAWLAPAHRLQVATFVYIGGIAYAIYFAAETGLWICLGSAAAAGAITCWAVARRS
jgi:hypothetical protein